jgi:hypothetical protein
MAEVACAVDGCGYRGTVSEVEAHISGSTSGGHSGEVGRHHREELVSRAERRGGGAADLAGSQDATVEGDVSDGPGEVGSPALEQVGGLPPRWAMAVVAMVFIAGALSSSGDVEREPEVEHTGTGLVDG